MGPRAGLSGVLIAGAVVLVVAIAIGNSMGNRVLGQITGRGPAYATTPVPSPSATEADNRAAQLLWKRRQVLSVATDPAFPDPRVTPEPPVPVTPRPVSQVVAKPSPTPRPSPTAGPTKNPYYTSPPLPIPLATDSGGAAPSPEASAVSPNPRATPTVPGRAGAARGPATQTPPTLSP